MLAVREIGRGRQFQIERRSQHLEQPLGDEFRPCVHGGAVDQDDELIAAEATDGIGLSHGHQQTLGDGLQELVPHPVPLGVVHLLEPVEIDEQGGNRNVSPPGPGQHLLGAVENQSAVGQARQGIVHCLETDLVDEAGIGDGDGRLRRQALESIGEPRRDGQALGVAGDTSHDESHGFAGHDDRCRNTRHSAHLRVRRLHQAIVIHDIGLVRRVDPSLRALATTSSG